MIFHTMRLVPFLSVLLLGMLLQGCSGQKESNEPEEIIEETPVTSKPQQGFSELSIYQLDGEWHTQDGDTVELSMLKGKIPVMAMVFTNCGYACPRMVEDMRNIEAQVPANKREDVRYVLVSFDAERDTPERLKAYAGEEKLGENWILLHGNEEDVRELSMLLDVQYKKQSTGDFAHSNSIALLNREGAIVAKVEGLGVDPAPILEKLKTL